MDIKNWEGEIPPRPTRLQSGDRNPLTHRKSEMVSFAPHSRPDFMPNIWRYRWQLYFIDRISEMYYIIEEIYWGDYEGLEDKNEHSMKIHLAILRWEHHPRR